MVLLLYMKAWETKCQKLLDKSLKLPIQELNELDWKEDISAKNESLAKHLSAFTNYPGGGFMIFGIQDNGNIVGVDNSQIEDITKKLGNIARSNIVPPISLDHSILELASKPILAVYIAETSHKPAHLKSGTIYDSCIRSAGQSRKLSQEEVQKMIAVSQGLTFEKRVYPTTYQLEDIIAKLDYVTYFDLLEAKQPSTQEEIAKVLESEQLIVKNNTGYQMTNFGIILLAKDLDEYPEIKRKTPRVIKYEGKDRTGTIIKQNEENSGYAPGFSRIINLVNTLIPSNEVIKEVLRKEVLMYPPRAIRELIANALIHQDFDISGSGVTVEIFDDRLEITNPGRPFVEVNRLMDLPPRSRNEALASIMRRLHICEELGSGIDKVVIECEAYQLPAPLFETRGDNMVAILYSPRILTRMEKQDRIRACYQHACLKSVSNGIMTNETVRKRFSIESTNYPTASKIIKETLDSGLIRFKNPEGKSRRNFQYVPYWY